jgi:hypothetical protein
MSIPDEDDLLFDEEEDEEDLWDEVVVPETATAPGPSVYDLIDLEEPAPRPNVEITVSVRDIKGKGKDSEKCVT